MTDGRNDGRTEAIAIYRISSKCAGIIIRVILWLSEGF